MQRRSVVCFSGVGSAFGQQGGCGPGSSWGRGVEGRSLTAGRGLRLERCRRALPGLAASSPVGSRGGGSGGGGDGGGGRGRMFVGSVSSIRNPRLRSASSPLLETETRRRSARELWFSTSGLLGRKLNARR